MTSQKELYNYLENSISTDTFIRLTLSKHKDKSSELKKIIIKLVIIKQQAHLSFIYRHTTKDITKNYLLDTGLTTIQSLIAQQFCIANLFTSAGDYNLEILASGKEKFRKLKPTFQKVPERQHDKHKTRLITGTNYLKELGVLDAKGRIQKDKGDKYKQINKFIEIIDGLLRKNANLQKEKHLKVVDMGAGKGYLTFALYDYLINTQKITAEVVGVEVRPDLIEKCNTIARKVGFHQLKFKEGYITNYTLATTDILIALHACDTATDDAIYKGIQANAQLIICAPCCHKQIRKQIKESIHLQPILDYGILKERQAEMITDTIRALLLEAAGYKTKVFEFISTEHTGKNIMIIGQKKHPQQKDPAIYLQKIESLKQEFGIEYHYLEKLVNGKIERKA